ncbi:Neuroblast differentiation-associated protein AHNAK [Oryzias melastigma]|uniref:Neuroblast differentiation-associated protein AHNAK n=1 Tax=Oryzias melastigma TaxID=30732 RepID=A0A834FRV3_ORYME|nr:Neuroblast differentiation-associated protein AHNAK [Oryzias melastigma]
MARHRRGRSLSEALTLDQLEEGGVVISSISNPKHSQDLKEGDEIMGATINFDQLSKEEVLKVLKLMEPFEDKIQVHTRNNLSKSLSDLDVCARNPEKMLTDSYSKLYKTKIKKFLKDDLPSDEGSIASGEPTATPASKVKPKHDTELPRLGVDFGLLKPKTPKTDASSDLTDDSNMALPSLSLGFNGGSQSDTEEPRLDLNTPKTFPEGLKAKTFGDPEVDFELKDLDVAVPMVEADLKREDIPTTSVDGPKLNIKGTSPQSKGPKYNFPKLSISGPSLNGPEGQIDLPDVATKQEPSGKPSVKKSKRIKPPDLNLDDPSSFVEFLELKSGDLDLDSPSHGLPNLEFDAKTKDDVKRPKKKAIDLSVPSVGIKSSTKKYKPPKFEMPKFDLPEIPIPDLDGDFKQADVQLTTPDNDITFPDGELNIQGPSGKPHHRSSGLDIDNPSAKFQGPSPKMYTNVSMKTPVLDIDQDVRLRPNRRASRSNVRSSYPAANAALYPHMDFRHSDLNIDDFTGKDYVLRARGSNLDLSERHNYGQMIPTPRVHVDSRGSRKPRPMTTNDFTLPGLSHSLHKVPQYGSDGYLVTVFPNQTPNSKMQNLKYNTPKRQNFLPTNLDLDVPYQNNLKGSTFFFSNVV